MTSRFTMHHARRYAVVAVTLSVVITAAYLIYAGRRALVSSHTAVIGRVTAAWFAQYVREHDGRWPPSWEALLEVEPPLHFEAGAANRRQLLQTCRSRIDADFSADPAEIARQSPAEFTALRARDGDQHDRRETWQVASLIEAVRQFHPPPADAD